MTTYYNKTELLDSLNLLVNQYFKECKSCKELPQGFIDLLKHNFLAKFVCFNEEQNCIEIGIENVNSSSPYPEIEVHRYSINSKKWVDNSFKDGKCDLDFYGRLLNRQRQSARNVDVVVM